MNEAASPWEKVSLREKEIVLHGRLFGAHPS